MLVESHDPEGRRDCFDTNYVVHDQAEVMLADGRRTNELHELNVDESKGGVGEATPKGRRETVVVTLEEYKNLLEAQFGENYDS